MLSLPTSAMHKALIAFASFFYTSAVYAEVIDKVPTLLIIWVVAITSGMVCLVATYFRRWLLILIVFPALWFLSLFLEIYSPDVGPALLIEAGNGYVAQVYLAVFFITALGALGWILNARKRRA